MLMLIALAMIFVMHRRNSSQPQHVMKSTTIEATIGKMTVPNETIIQLPDGRKVPLPRNMQDVPIPMGSTLFYNGQSTSVSQNTYVTSEGAVASGAPSASSVIGGASAVPSSSVPSSSGYADNHNETIIQNADNLITGCSWAEEADSYNVGYSAFPISDIPVETYMSTFSGAGAACRTYTDRM